MVHIEVSVVINRPVVDVFTFFTEPTNNPKWEEGLVKKQLQNQIEGDMARLKKVLEG